MALVKRLGHEITVNPSCQIVNKSFSYKLCSLLIQNRASG